MFFGNGFNVRTYFRETNLHFRKTYFRETNLHFRKTYFRETNLHFRRTYFRETNPHNPSLSTLPLQEEGENPIQKDWSNRRVLSPTSSYSQMPG